MRVVELSWICSSAVQFLVRRKARGVEKCYGRLGGLGEAGHARLSHRAAWRCQDFPVRVNNLRRFSPVVQT